ncbi:MAG: hypothetical protein ABC542_05345, partial [Candidatus Methanosuratincola petrocarbonis]
MPNSIQVLQEPALTRWLERIRGKPSPSAGKGGREEDEEEQEEGADAAGNRATAALRITVDLSPPQVVAL